MTRPHVNVKFHRRKTVEQQLDQFGDRWMDVNRNCSVAYGPRFQYLDDGVIASSPRGHRHRYKFSLEPWLFNATRLTAEGIHIERTPVKLSDIAKELVNSIV
jgi:hypothetical protein